MVVSFKNFYKIATLVNFFFCFLPFSPTPLRLSYWLVTLTTIVGQVEERGLFPGRIKLVSEGLTPKKLVMLGEEKSSISLFSIIPVLVISFEPKYVLIVLREEKWEWGEIQRVGEDAGRCVCVGRGEGR